MVRPTLSPSARQRAPTLPNAPPTLYDSPRLIPIVKTTPSPDARRLSSRSISTPSRSIPPRIDEFATRVQEFTGNGRQRQRRDTPEFGEFGAFGAFGAKCCG